MQNKVLLLARFAEMVDEVDSITELRRMLLFERHPKIRGAKKIIKDRIEFLLCSRCDYIAF